MRHYHFFKAIKTLKLFERVAASKWFALDEKENRHFINVSKRKKYNTDKNIFSNIFAANVTNIILQAIFTNIFIP